MVARASTGAGTDIGMIMMRTITSKEDEELVGTAVISPMASGAAQGGKMMTVERASTTSD